MAASTSEIVLKFGASEFFSEDIVEGIRAIVREEIAKAQPLITSNVRFSTSRATS